jgi:hypothetical protein
MEDREMTTQTENQLNVNQVIEHFNTKENVKSFFYKHDIAEVESIDSIEQYDADEGRKGFIMKVLEKKNNEPITVIIDVRQGLPSIDQVFDAVYGRGRACVKRLIMFAENYNADDVDNPAVDEYVVESLIESLNEYPLNLHLIKIESADLEAAVDDLDCLEGEGNEYDLNELPSQLQFRFDEFWYVYFDSLNQGYYSPWKAFEGGFADEFPHWGYMTELEYGLEAYLWWKDREIVYAIKQIRDSDDRLKRLWNKKKDEIINHFNASKVAFECLRGKLPKLEIKFPGRSHDWLLAATPKEKMESARVLYEGFFELVNYFYELTEGMNQTA